MDYIESITLSPLLLWHYTVAVDAVIEIHTHVKENTSCSVSLRPAQVLTVFMFKWCIVLMHIEYRWYSIQWYWIPSVHCLQHKMNRIFFSFQTKNPEKCVQRWIESHRIREKWRIFYSLILFYSGKQRTWYWKTKLSSNWTILHNWYDG